MLSHSPAPREVEMRRLVTRQKVRTVPPAGRSDVRRILSSPFPERIERQMETPGGPDAQNIVDDRAYLADDPVG